MRVKRFFLKKTLEKRIQVCGCSGQRIHLLWGGYTGKGIDVCVQELTGNATWCPGFGRGNVHVIPDKKFKALGQYGHVVLAVCI